ncbi:hypothetical protein THTE_3595 [Thermogutta terrifontis]|uniref:Uncharacterized protein n=1 Tax=Thermogutta terrifontis TaxID=1331910 RepID=A0A286RJS0_9BACT|nr:hypothetical protein THTE_3595 [Thermogutta terrifontis]
MKSITYVGNHGVFVFHCGEAPAGFEPANGGFAIRCTIT